MKNIRHGKQTKELKRLRIENDNLKKTILRKNKIIIGLNRDILNLGHGGKFRHESNDELDKGYDEVFETNE